MRLWPSKLGYLAKAWGHLKRGLRRKAFRRAARRFLPVRVESLEERRLLAFTTLFTDDFESGTVSTTKWPNDLLAFSARPFAASRSVTNPHGTYAAVFSTILDNKDIGMQSRAIDLSGYRHANVIFWCAEKSAEVGENLVLRYLNSSGTWVDHATLTPSMIPSTSLVQNTRILPPNAFHSGFRFALVAKGMDGNGLGLVDEEWIVDDVRVEAAQNDLPTIHFVQNTGPVNEDQAVTVTIGATDGDGDSLTYGFDFDNNGSYETTNIYGYASNVFDDGTHQVNVQVTDGYGGVRTDKTTVTVLNVAPTIQGITQNGPISQGSPLALVVSASDVAGAADPLTYLFDFDKDGAYEVAGATNSVVHTFFESGVQQVDFAVRDDGGAMATGQVEVTVLSVTPPIDDENAPPRAYFASAYASLAETAGSVTITAQLSKPAEQAVTILLSYSGTAASGADYGPAASITIAAAQLTGSATIQIANDTQAEGNETIIVKMLAPTNAELATHPAHPISQVVTILASDTVTASFLAANMRAAESDGYVDVKIELNNAASDPVVIPLTYSGSAVPGQDFQQLPASLTVARETKSVVLRLPFIDDEIGELQEEFYVTLGIPRIENGIGQAGLVGSTGTFTLIVDDDDTPAVSFSETVLSVWEDIGVVTFGVELSTVSTEDVTVPITVTSADAQVDGDYVLENGTLLISAGQSSGNVTLLITDDKVSEFVRTQPVTAYETMIVELGQPVNAILGSPEVVDQPVEKCYDQWKQFTDEETGETWWGNGGSVCYTVNEPVQIPVTYAYLYIDDDDPTVTLREIPDRWGKYPPLKESGGSANLLVELDYSPGYDVTVPLVYSGNATRGKDYQVSPLGSVVIPANELWAEVVVTTIDDPLEEAAETIVITTEQSFPPLPSSNRSRTLKIDDDDHVNQGIVEFARNTASIREGHDLEIKLVRTDSIDELVVTVQDVSGGKEFEVFMSDGTAEKSIPVSLAANNVRDYYAQQVYIIKSLSNGRIGANSRFTLTLVDDDAAATTVYTPSTLAVGDSVMAGPDYLPPVNPGFPPVAGLPTTVPEPGVFALGIGSGSQLSSSTIFLDLNKNSVLDPSEPSAATELDGSFLLFFPLRLDENRDGVFETQNGQLVLAGGSDPATGVPSGMLRAPFGSLVVSPLTTLMAWMVENELALGNEPDVFDVGLRVCEAFGLPPIDLRRFDPTAQAAAGNLQGAIVYAAQAQLHNTVKQIAAWLSGLPNAPPASQLENFVFADMANKIVERHSQLDLTHAVVLTTIIRGVLASTGLSDSRDDAVFVAAVIAHGNRYLASIPISADVGYLTSVAQMKKLAQEKIASELLQFAIGTKSYEDFIGYFTAAIKVAAQNMSVGNVAAPELRISDSRVLEGLSGDVWAEFVVTMAGPTRIPVSVDFTADDAVAIAATGDFEVALGTLTWNPGDAAEKTVKVKIKGDTSFEADEEFVVYLSNPQNAVLRDDLGVGTIVDDDWMAAVGTDQTAADEDLVTGLAAPPMTVVGFAGYIDGQARSFVVTNSDSSLFAGEDGQPVIDATGTLRFQPAPNVTGTTVVTIMLQDDAGNLTDPYQFNVEITKPHPKHNVVEAGDVSNDGKTAAEDALYVINFINAFSSQKVAMDAEFGPLFFDTTGDNNIAPEDALKVINWVNAFGTAPEGELTVSREGIANPAGDSASPLLPVGQFSSSELIGLLALDVALQPKRRR